tara:strand:+ start:971 stop:1456 length:486 start_codon:yes stop_codon:yes gene_type:complete
MSKQFIAALLCICFITGCSTTSVIEVVNPDLLDGEIVVATVIVSNSTGQAFDIDIESMLSKGLLDELSSQSMLDETSGKFNLDVSIVQYEKGNAFARWMVPGMGATVLSVEASLKDGSGSIIAQSQATKSIGAGGGYTIGAWSTVFKDISKTLVTDLVSIK